MQHILLLIFSFGIVYAEGAQPIIHFLPLSPDYA